MKRLVLKQHKIGPEEYKYRVIQLSNAVSPKVGATLSEKDANDYCRNAHWSVTVKGAA